MKQNFERMNAPQMYEDAFWRIAPWVLGVAVAAGVVLAAVAMAG